MGKRHLVFLTLLVRCVSDYCAELEKEEVGRREINWETIVGGSDMG